MGRVNLICCFLSFFLYIHHRPPSGSPPPVRPLKRAMLSNMPSHSGRASRAASRAQASVYSESVASGSQYNSDDEPVDDSRALVRYTGPPSSEPVHEDPPLVSLPARSTTSATVPASFYGQVKTANFSFDSVAYANVGPRPSALASPVPPDFPPGADGQQFVGAIPSMSGGPSGFPGAPTIGRPGPMPPGFHPGPPPQQSSGRAGASQSERSSRDSKHSHGSDKLADPHIKYKDGVPVAWSRRPKPKTHHHKHDWGRWDSGYITR